MNKVNVLDYPDGSQTAQIVYTQGIPSDKPDANQKFVFIWLTTRGSPVTLDSLSQPFREVAWDILSVTVRGQAGFTFWRPSVAAGNSAWLAWNEGDLTITIALYGDWPQPTETDSHALDNILLQIAASLGNN